MSVQPTNLALNAQGQLIIDWSDGQQRRYRAFELRDNCPCATCREKRKAPEPTAEPASMQLNVLSAAEAQPLAIRGMKPVGRYAYSIDFSDGHDTGIYTFESLLEMGESV